MGMAFRRECLHELADCGEVAEPETEGRFWLGEISILFTANVQLYYQSIEGASMLVEPDIEPYH